MVFIWSAFLLFIYYFKMTKKNQFIYNPFNDLDFYRKNFVMILGTWHPYKLAVENTFFKFLPTFLGPAYHALFPESKIMFKPKLSQLEHFFSMLACAYPFFRTQLLAVFAQSNPQQRFYSDIQNLHDLFEFFLPLVRFYNLLFMLFLRHFYFQ